MYFKGKIADFKLEAETIKGNTESFYWPEKKERMQQNKQELIQLIQLQMKLATKLYIHEEQEEYRKSQHQKFKYENGQGFESEEDSDSYDSSFIDDTEEQNEQPSPEKKPSKKKKKIDNTRLYNYLEVKPNVNIEKLRSQYKKLSRQWHPDKNKSPHAEERMKSITLAYRVLSDSTERSRYGKSVNFSY